MTFIRRARPADLAAVRDVFRRASLANAGDRELLLAHPEYLVWPDALAAGRTRVAILDDGDDGDDAGVVGFASTVVTGGVLELEDLFVAPERMRHGVASHLVRDVLVQADAEGFAYVYVTANPHARAFYKSTGFVPDGFVSTPHGAARRMRLDLTDRQDPADPDRSAGRTSPRPP